MICPSRCDPSPIPCSHSMPSNLTPEQRERYLKAMERIRKRRAKRRAESFANPRPNQSGMLGTRPPPAWEKIATKGIWERYVLPYLPHMHQNYHAYYNFKLIATQRRAKANFSVAFLREISDWIPSSKKQLEVLKQYDEGTLIWMQTAAANYIASHPKPSVDRIELHPERASQRALGKMMAEGGMQ